MGFFKDSKVGALAISTAYQFEKPLHISERYPIISEA
jgi:hypothetical protein